MKTATATIQSLMTQVSEGALRLPEIQRAYVWKPAQIAGLLDSLYRHYPSGSILLWQTTEVVTEKEMDTAAGNAPVFVQKPLYLLDGQQRLTSLHRVYTGHERARVVFNVVTERFQIESSATKIDRRWVPVKDVLTGGFDMFRFVNELADAVPDLDPGQLFTRLQRLQQVGNYTYYLEILDDLPYPEVTEVFVRVNSRGRALKETDLALATLSARWPGAVARFDTLHERSRNQRYQDLDIAFLVRAFAALATDTTSPSGFSIVPTERLESAWGQLERGVAHTINLLMAEIGIDNTTVLPSANALIPIVYYLGTRPDVPLSAEERKALVYWLLLALIQARYSSSAATVIAQDVSALRSGRGLEGLLANLGVLETQVEINPTALAGKGSTSAYFLLCYLAVRRNGARDWWYGSPVALSHDGTYKVEYHHVHPRARLASTYSRPEINDLANLAFISDRANRKISSRPPVTYFEELEALDPSFLRGHFVPTDPTLRTVEAYPQFVARRRELLAAAMNDLLRSYRPSSLGTATAASAAGEPSSLIMQAYGTSVDADDIVLVLRATLGASSAEERLNLSDLRSVLTDLEDGHGAEIEIGGDLLSITAETDEVELPVGPLRVHGTVAEWAKVVERELEELLPLTELSAPAARATVGSAVPFYVLDSE